MPEGTHVPVPVTGCFPAIPRMMSLGRFSARARAWRYRSPAASAVAAKDAFENHSLCEFGASRMSISTSITFEQRASRNPAIVCGSQPILQRSISIALALPSARESTGADRLPTACGSVHARSPRPACRGYAEQRVGSDRIGRRPNIAVLPGTSGHGRLQGEPRSRRIAEHLLARKVALGHRASQPLLPRKR
jgi:hypothetical protein